MSVGFEDVIAAVPQPGDDHPAAVADRMWAESPARALRGLREAALDVVELLRDVHGSQLSAFDARFANAGAPTLSDMRSRSWRNLRRSEF